MILNNKNKNIISATFLAGAGVGLCYILLRNRQAILRQLRIALDWRNPLRHQHIEIVSNAEECRKVILEIKSHCNELKVLGFDCEWVTVGGTRRPVALLQLATHRGLCALIRLCNIQRIPRELKDILEDYEIVKVGVVPLDDANYLYRDYGVHVQSTLDLRHLAALGEFKPEGLGKMSKAHLNVELNKNWRLSCSDWEANELNRQQIIYAANDAHVAIELFRVFINKTGMYDSGVIVTKDTPTIYEQYLDLKFMIQQKKTSNSRKGTPKREILPKQQNRFLSTRSSLLYDNCYMQAPDGDVLCTCDRRRAEWYVSKELATVVDETPFTIRLKFEPSGRAVGDVGKFYQQMKINQCVVCGQKNSYIRKHVVPLEYRKFFPEVMKSHMSHDIVLLCPPCHQKSNISDLDVRKKLAIICNAPFSYKDGAVKTVEVPHLKKLQSTARALYYKADQIPSERLAVLESEFLSYYSPGTVITPELLKEACDVTPYEINENYVPHGQLVVDYFKDPSNCGLTALERIWRRHFLDVMKPKYLPELWSIDHNYERLEIRAEEGRIDEVDLLLAGVKTLDEMLNESIVDKLHDNSTGIELDETIHNGSGFNEEKLTDIKT